MKTVTVYYAFDDTDFYVEEECREYEEEWLNAFREIRECYAFFDKDMNTLVCAGDELENLMEWIEKGYDNSSYLYIKKVPSVGAARKIDYYYGYVFPDKTGFYRADNEEGNWKRVE